MCIAAEPATPPCRMASPVTLLSKPLLAKPIPPKATPKPPAKLAGRSVSAPLRPVGTSSVRGRRGGKASSSKGAGADQSRSECGFARRGDASAARSSSYRVGAPLGSMYRHSEHETPPPRLAGSASNCAYAAQLGQRCGRSGFAMAAAGAAASTSTMGEAPKKSCSVDEEGGRARCAGRFLPKLELHVRHSVIECDGAHRCRCDRRKQRSASREDGASPEAEPAYSRTGRTPGAVAAVCGRQVRLWPPAVAAPPAKQAQVQARPHK